MEVIRLNIQGILQQIGNIIANSNGNNAGAEAVARQPEVAQPEVQNQQPAPAQQAETNVKMANQDAINSLLKELTDKLSASQKTIDNMPENLKNQIRQLLSERTSLADMREGMANLVQNQKQSMNNLTKLADALNNIAKFLAEAEEGEAAKTDKMNQLPLKDSAANSAQAKEAVQEKISSQLLKELLDSIVTKPNEQAVKPAQQQEQGKDAQNAKQPTADGKPAENNANKEQVVNNREQATKEAANNNAANNKVPVKDAPNNQQQMNNMRPPEGAENTKQPQQNQQANQAQNAVKGEAANANNSQQTQMAAKPEQPVTTQQAQTQPQQPSNSLLAAAKNDNAANSNMPKEPVTMQEVARLVQNLNKTGDILKELMQQKPELARAMQTLENNPASLSSSDKAMLHSLLARIIKDTFKFQEDVNVLDKALNKFTGKTNMPMDKETADLQAMNRLLKNTDSLQHSKQQVQDWANSLREIATGMAKTANLPGEKTTQHLQTSFVFYLAGEEKEKNQPVYINIYHEKESENGNGIKTPAETWLRVNISPEYVGEVTAIFHLYQENLLDVKVIFEREEGMAEFSRFVPSIKNALQDSNMQINSILVV